MLCNKLKTHFDRSGEFGAYVRLQDIMIGAAITGPCCHEYSQRARRRFLQLDADDIVNATVGFEALAEEIHKPAKSLHRMLSQSGNPTMSNISAVFAAIKRALKVEVHTQIVMA